MPRVRYSVIALVGLLPVDRAFAVGMDGQRIVVRRCVAALPPEMCPFFELHVADLQERAVEPEGVWRRDRKMRGRRHWDHLWMDVKAKDGSVSARLAAAEAFPRREREAREIFKSEGSGKRGGRLPWAVEDLFSELVRAFEERDESEIIRAAGYLTHFAWAASQPFSVTMNHDGRQTGNLYLGELSMGDPYFQHQSVHHRLFGELVRRYRNRYLEHVQVRPIELQPIAEPLEPCFRHLLGSLARVDDVLTADREITEQLGAKDGASLIRREDEYYELLDARCGDIIVERLRAGSMLAANLIAGAWERSGRPALGGAKAERSGQTKAPQAGPGPPAKTSENSVTMSYVGSKSSKVFHRSDCPHVERISPENLVRYDSADDARGQGKRACRTCKPE